MFIIWSKQSQLAEILQPFTESYNVHTNSAVALQLLNMIKKLGIEGMFEWLNESELVAKKTSKVNLVENFRIFIKDTEKKIDMWLEKYNVFNVTAAELASNGARIKTLIVANPSLKFSESDKIEIIIDVRFFYLDQCSEIILELSEGICSFALFQYLIIK